MKEREMRARIEWLLARAVRMAAVPASVGMAMVLGACGETSLSLPDSVETPDHSNPTPGTAKYMAQLPDAAPTPTAKYMAQLPDAAPTPTAKYMAQLPDAAPTPSASGTVEPQEPPPAARYMAQLPDAGLPTSRYMGQLPEPG